MSDHVQILPVVPITFFTAKAFRSQSSVAFSCYVFVFFLSSDKVLDLFFDSITWRVLKITSHFLYNIFFHSGLPGIFSWLDSGYASLADSNTGRWSSHGFLSGGTRFPCVPSLMRTVSWIRRATAIKLLLLITHFLFSFFCEDFCEGILRCRAKSRVRCTYFS